MLTAGSDTERRRDADDARRWRVAGIGGFAVALRGGLALRVLAPSPLWLDEALTVNIARLDGGPKGATLTFHNDKFANPAGLVDYLQAQNGHAKVKDNKVVIRRDWSTDAEKIKGAFSIAVDLAEKAGTVKRKAG